MKKIRVIVIILVALVILTFPIKSVYDDGGTVSYSALLCKVVCWHSYQLIDGQMYIYENTSVYFFPMNFKDLSDLWEEYEQEKMDVENLRKPVPLY